MKYIPFLLLFLLVSFGVLGQNKNKTVRDKTLKTEIKYTLQSLSNDGSEDSIIIKTWEWKKYKFVETGTPDYRGRYGYIYELFVVNNGQAKKINNSELFNGKINQLEKIVNQRIKHDFDEYIKDPNSSECFPSKVYTKIKIDDMGLSFSESNEIIFNVSFGLGGYCYSVDGTTVSFKLRDLKKYIKE